MSGFDDLAREILEIGWGGRKTAFGPCEGFIYFVATKGPSEPHVKIGFSKQDPRLRMASLQTGNHRPLRILSFMPGCREMEKALHHQLARYRTSGEWFRYTSEVSFAIEKHIIDHGLAANDPDNFVVRWA